MADLSKLREELKGISKEMSGVKSNLLAATEQTSDFTTKLAGLATVSTTGGSIWSAFARFTKGNLFFIQKQVRGFANIAKVVVNIEGERIKAQTKLINMMKQQGELLETSVKTYTQIDSILNGSNKRTAKAIFLQDSFNKLKIREMGFEEFLTEQKMDALNATKQQLANERKLVDTQKARENLSAFSKGRIGGKGQKHFQTGFFRDPEIEATLVQLLGIDDEIRGLREGIKLADTDEEKAQLQGEVDNRLTMTEILREELENQFGIIVETFEGTGTTANVRTKNRDSLFERFSKFNVKTFTDLINIAKKAFLSYFSKKNFNKIFRFAVTGLMVFGKILYGITLLGLLVFLLHKSGFIDRVIQFIETHSEIIKDYLSFYMELGAQIFDFISGFATFIYGLFTGQGKLVEEGLVFMKDALLGALETIIKIAIGTLVLAGSTLVMTATNLLISTIQLAAEFLLEKGQAVGEAAGRYLPALGMTSGAAAGASIGFKAGTLFGLPGVVVGTALGAGLGYAGGKAAQYISGLSTGGTVSSGGLFMVGERGPELVHLPAGSAVYNNQQTRGMMGGSTINVHVNGRVGASDAELDDIARKIGRKINLEMNRYNNSGYRA